MGNQLEGAPLALQIFMCADLWKDTETLRAAYHDSKGVTEAFIKNGMQHALRTLGCEAAGHPSKWDYEVPLCSLKQPEVCVGLPRLSSEDPTLEGRQSPRLYPIPVWRTV